MTIEQELETRRDQLRQAKEELQLLQVRIAELEAGIELLERMTGPVHRPKIAPVQPKPTLNMTNLGVSEAARLVLRGSGDVMTINDVHQALLRAGRDDDREAVALALAYLVRAKKAARADRGKYVKR